MTTRISENEKDIKINCGFCEVHYNQCKVDNNYYLTRIKGASWINNYLNIIIYVFCNKEKIFIYILLIIFVVFLIKKNKNKNKNKYK